MYKCKVDRFARDVNSYGMTDNHTNKYILDAATVAFMRYGYKRVTMADLAAAAEISRPTLYAAFQNKEEVFRGVVTRIMESAIADLQDKAAGNGKLTKVLTDLFEIWVVKNYELVHQSPDARELLEYSQSFSRDIIESAYEQFDKILADVLKRHVAEIKKPEHLARTLSASARGIKESARDVTDLRNLLRGLIELAVAGLKPSSS